MAHAPDGEVVGWGNVSYSRIAAANRHMRAWEIGVRPDHRRRGVGRALLRRVVESVEGQGEDLVFSVQATDRVPACREFARAIGATAGI